MARATERIERDIAMLKEALQVIAAELESAYAAYLTTLGQTLQKQLILASYHLCTQGYPENFLSLSLTQRQKLQQAIRKLGQQANEQLLTYIRSEKEQEIEAVEAEEVKDEEGEVEDSAENLESQVQNPRLFDLSNPRELAQWQQELEEIIQEILKKLSRDANLLIQKVGVLPKKLPEPILAAAAAASEASNEVMPGPPNLLNLVVEIGSESDAQNSGLKHIMAINLRLGDIEFADAKLLSERKQIRNILIQLNKLGREYQNKQRELTVAEAEAAWRASWFDN